MINDFIEYWTASRLLLQRGNPYSPPELLTAQQALGWTEAEPLIMWNPPWTLSFTIPLGLLEYETAQFVWFLSHALILFLGSRQLWKTYGGGAQRSHYPIIAVLTFAPAYFALLLGQIGPLVLLGVVGFLVAAKRKAWGLAGLSLSLAAIKPHLLYLFWLALFLWIFKERKWRLLLAFLTAGMGVAGLPLFFDGQIYSHYFQLLGGSGVVRPLEWATPALGTALAQLFAIPGAWIRWLPSLAGAAWLFWYWSHWQGEWNWTSQWPFILVVSTATAGFAWTFDHIILLPAVVQTAVWISQCEAKRKRLAFVGMHVALAVTLVLMKIFVRNDFWYFWAAPTYLLLYLYARAAIGTLNKSVTNAVHP